MPVHLRDFGLHLSQIAPSLSRHYVASVDPSQSSNSERRLACSVCFTPFVCGRSCHVRLTKAVPRLSRRRPASASSAYAARSILPRPRLVFLRLNKYRSVAAFPPTVQTPSTAAVTKAVTTEKKHAKGVRSRRGGAVVYSCVVCKARTVMRGGPNKRDRDAAVVATQSRAIPKNVNVANKVAPKHVSLVSSSKPVPLPSASKSTHNPRTGANAPANPAPAPAKSSVKLSTSIATLPDKSTLHTPIVKVPATKMAAAVAACPTTNNLSSKTKQQQNSKLNKLQNLVQKSKKKERDEGSGDGGFNIEDFLL